VYLPPGNLVEVGSDRQWEYDASGQWHLSVQHVTNGQLETVLPDRPMAGTTLIYDDIAYHWHLSPTAYSETDCVALSLAEALELNIEDTKCRLKLAAHLRREDSSQGYTRACVKDFLQDHTNRTGEEVGWKIFQGSRVVDETPKKDKFLAFNQRAGHLYLYKRGCRALNNTHRKMLPWTIFCGLREFTRDLTCIPYEMRTRFLESETTALSLWRIKSDRKRNEEDVPFELYTQLQPGVFSPTILLRCTTSFWTRATCPRW